MPIVQRPDNTFTDAINPVSHPTAGPGNPDIDGTDLGIAAALPTAGEFGMLFGDTFTTSDNLPRGPRHDGGPTPWALSRWRSPVPLICKLGAATAPAMPHWAPHNGAQLWDYPRTTGEYTTVLPTDMITLYGSVFVTVMVTNGLGHERAVEIWESRNSLEGPWIDRTPRNGTGVTSSRFSTSWAGGTRVMLTMDRSRVDDWIYVASTGGLQRNKGIYFWRAPRDGFQDDARWQSMRRAANGSWYWGTGPADEAIPGRFGELNLRWVQGYWVLSGFDAGGYRMFSTVLGKNVFEKSAPNPNTNYNRGNTVWPVRGTWQGFGSYDILANLYGGYIHPASKFRNPDGSGAQASMFVSQWTPDGGAYCVKQYAYTLPPVPGSELVHTDPNPATGGGWR